MEDKDGPNDPPEKKLNMDNNEVSTAAQNGQERSKDSGDDSASTLRKRKRQSADLPSVSKQQPLQQHHPSSSIILPNGKLRKDFPRFRGAPALHCSIQITKLATVFNEST